MIHSLELENFKAFGKRARIPFAPITLIFGENSAGKSTILQALNLLKQTRESRDVGAPLSPRVENGIVDLGSFQEMIFDHELDRTLFIRVETAINNKKILQLPYTENKIAIEFGFKTPDLKPDIILDQIKISSREDSECIAKFIPLGSTEIHRDSSMRMRYLRDPRSLSPSKLTTVKCDSLTKDTKYWEMEFNWFSVNKSKTLELLKERLNEFRHPTRDLPQNSRFEEDLHSLKHSIEFFSSDFNCNSYISERHRNEMSTMLGIQGFIPIRSVSDRKNSWVSLLSLSELRSAKIFNIAHLAGAAGHALEQGLLNLFPMGPFRRPPERWYIFTGTSPQDVGYRGDLLPDLLFRQPELVDDTNKWLKRLEIGYKLDVKSGGDNLRDLFEVRLIDTRRRERVGEDSIDIALPDVGFGISQLLPFVVQSLISERQIISIEQPEVHVHPRLQADLGDLLAEAIQRPRQNQFIIETHSEHLILRLQRLIYEKKIKPQEVSVVYVSRGPDGAKSQRLNLDEEGDFIDEWPDGFFPERLRELR